MMSTKLENMNQKIQFFNKVWNKTPYIKRTE